MDPVSDRIQGQMYGSVEWDLLAWVGIRTDVHHGTADNVSGPMPRIGEFHSRIGQEFR